MIFSTLRTNFILGVCGKLSIAKPACEAWLTADDTSLGATGVVVVRVMAGVVGSGESAVVKLGPIVVAVGVIAGVADSGEFAVVKPG